MPEGAGVCDTAVGRSGGEGRRRRWGRARGDGVRGPFAGCGSRRGEGTLGKLGGARARVCGIRLDSASD